MKVSNHHVEANKKLKRDVYEGLEIGVVARASQERLSRRRVK
jgi:hypothetical protein